MMAAKKVTFYRLPCNKLGNKLIHVAYLNHEVNIHDSVHQIFHNSQFDLPAPKLIILLEGGLNTCSEKLNNFDEQKFSNSVSRLMLDIGKDKLSDEQGAPWLFTDLRDDSLASRIIKTTKHQYLANDIDMTRFVTMGIDVCRSISPTDTPVDYQSLIGMVSKNFKAEFDSPTCSSCFSNHSRPLKKRLLHNILYGQKENDSIDRHTVLQSCIQEISRLRDSDKSECVSIPKLILLYGGDVDIAEPIHRFLSTPVDRRKFGLVIIQGTGGLADVLAWVCRKIRAGGTFFSDSNPNVLKNAFLRQLQVLVNEALNGKLTDELLKLIIYLATVQCRKVRVCDEEDDLSFSLLQVLGTENQKQRLPSIRLHLSLAFDLNQPKFASQMLRANRDIPEEDLIQLAKMAIVRNQVEFLHVLDDTCGLNSSSFGENVESELSFIMNYNHQLFIEFIERDFGCKVDDICRTMEDKDEHGDDETNSNNVKLFLWSVFFDHYSLSLHFWRRLQDRLCGALVAARIYRYIADLCTRRSSAEIVTIEKLRKQANDYEDLALELIKFLYASNATMARLALKRENFEFNKLSALDAAINSQSEHFVSHTSVQQVFDVLWGVNISTPAKTKNYERILSSAAGSFAQQIENEQIEQNIFTYIINLPRKICVPRIKYQLHFLCYFVFLGTLSYFSLFVQAPLPSSEEYIRSENHSTSQNHSSKKDYGNLYLLRQLINLWVFAFAIEEFRQAKLFKKSENTIFQAFSLYLQRSTNKLDCLCIIVYVLSLILESFNTPTYLNAARAFLVINIVLWFIRLLVFFMIYRTVGPMLLMIRQMLHDVWTFFSIFLVFTSAYGVASLTLLKVEQPTFDFRIFRKLFHAAYWHVFGHIDELENIQGDFKPTGWTAFLILVLYMAISNILLMNVLVAMLSNTFDRMYSKMDILWKFHRYNTIKEYIILGPLPPPFNLFAFGNYAQSPVNATLSLEQILNLRRREALAFECGSFAKNKSKGSDINRQEKFSSELQNLRKMISNIKVTCESSNLKQ